MKQRIVTAIIALIILVPLIVYGNLPFLIFSFLFAIIALYELLRMNDANNGKVHVLISVIFLCLIVYPETTIHFGNSTLTMYEILLIFLVTLLAITVLSKNKITFDQASVMFFATLFIGSAFHALISTRMLGLNYMMFILFIIWATDSGAYFVGKSFGKRKLWPVISPNKTIGGAIGGIVMALVVGITFQLVYPFEYSLMTIIGITLLISIFGQLGDLVASAMKRHYHVKDSGKLFPGHGGILDRLDSLLFVLIILKLVQFV